MQDKPNKNPRRGEGRVLFIAQIEQFRERIKAGHGQNAIYDEFGGKAKLGISYSQFNRYMIRYIIGKKDKDSFLQKKDFQPFNQVQPSHPEADNSKYDIQTPNSRTDKHSTKLSGFKHHPNGSNRDDLI